MWQYVIQINVYGEIKETETLTEDRLERRWYT